MFDKEKILKEIVIALDSLEMVHRTVNNKNYIGDSDELELSQIELSDPDKLSISFKLRWNNSLMVIDTNLDIDLSQIHNNCN